MSSTTLQDTVLQMVEQVTGTQTAAADHSRILGQLDTVNTEQMAHYLEANNAVHMKAITCIIRAAVAEMLNECATEDSSSSSSQLTVADVDKLVTAVRKTSVRINNLHEDTAVDATITQGDTTTLLKCIFQLVLQSTVPPAQSLVVTQLLDSIFALLSTTVTPLMQQQRWLCCQ